MTAKLDLFRTESPIGVIDYICQDGEIVSVDFDGHTAEAKRYLQRYVGDAEFSEPRWKGKYDKAFDRYFKGKIDALDDLPIRMYGTPFQLKVWKQLQKVAPGATASYGDIARAIKHPKAVRAVGLANGNNPIALIVPCHRVIGSDGSLTGYGGGLKRKAWLLAHERRHA